jgi:hypothetical protein
MYECLIRISEMYLLTDLTALECSDYVPTMQEVARSIPTQIFLCMNMSVCIGSGCFYVQYIC